MTAKLAIVVLLAIIGACTAALQTRPANTNPSYPGQCWENGQAYRPGQSWSIPGSCTEGSCYESSGSLYVSLASCGVIGVGPGCIKTDFDLSKNYPHCCPKEQC